MANPNPYPPTPSPQFPTRDQPSYRQQGNPFGPGPDMRHPGTNPVGTLPNQLQPRGMEAWNSKDALVFASDGTNQVARWNSPVFDLRPGLSTAQGSATPTYPINHEGALGLNTYMSVIVGTVTGALPIATQDCTCVYFEDGNNVNPDGTLLMRLTQEVDISDLLLAGGTSTVFPFGASALSFQPCVLGLRFWRLNLRFTITGIAVITEPYFIQSSLH